MTPSPRKVSAKKLPAKPGNRKSSKERRFSDDGEPRELVILTGLSGSGKASALRTFEDLGFYSVDNLPLELIPRFADLVAKSAEITHAALVVDVREGSRLERFPLILAKVRKVLPTRVVFLVLRSHGAWATFPIAGERSRCLFHLYGMTYQPST